MGTEVKLAVVTRKNFRVELWRLASYQKYLAAVYHFDSKQKAVEQAESTMRLFKELGVDDYYSVNVEYDETIEYIT